MTSINIKESYRDALDRYHNDNSPAVIYDDGTKVWVQHGLIHREDGPAVMWADGSEAWYQYDMRHRVDGPAYIDTCDGTVEWCIAGDLIDSRSEYQKRTKMSDEDLLVLILKYGGLQCS